MVTHIFCSAPEKVDTLTRLALDILLPLRFFNVESPAIIVVCHVLLVIWPL